MKKRPFFFLLRSGILIVSCIWILKNFRKESPTKKNHHIKCSNSTYFLPVAISKFTAANQPCLSIEIDHHIASAMLDLGFRGQFGFSSEFLSTIENKTYLRSRKMYGIRGTEYQEKLFKVPKISVGSISFFEPQLNEYSEAFHIDSTLTKGGIVPSISESGKVGKRPRRISSGNVKRQLTLHARHGRNLEYFTY